jgi:hypothetical protein
MNVELRNHMLVIVKALKYVQYVCVIGVTFFIKLTIN